MHICIIKNVGWLITQFSYSYQRDVARCPSFLLFQQPKSPISTDCCLALTHSTNILMTMVMMTVVTVHFTCSKLMLVAWWWTTETMPSFTGRLTMAYWPSKSKTLENNMKASPLKRLGQFRVSWWSTSHHHFTLPVMGCKASQLTGNHIIIYHVLWRPRHDASNEKSMRFPQSLDGKVMVTKRLTSPFVIAVLNSECIERNGWVEVDSLDGKRWTASRHQNTTKIETVACRSKSNGMDKFGRHCL